MPFCSKSPRSVPAARSFSPMAASTASARSPASSNARAASMASLALPTRSFSALRRLGSPNTSSSASTKSSFPSSLAKKSRNRPRWWKLAEISGICSSTLMGSKSSKELKTKSTPRLPSPPPMVLGTEKPNLGSREAMTASKLSRSICTILRSLSLVGTFVDWPASGARTPTT